MAVYFAGRLVAGPFRRRLDALRWLAERHPEPRRRGESVAALFATSWRIR